MEKSRPIFGNVAKTVAKNIENQIENLNHLHLTATDC